MYLRTCNRQLIETVPVKPGTAVICLYDPGNAAPSIMDERNCRARLLVPCSDVTEPMPEHVCLDEKMAIRIMDFWCKHRDATGGLLICCESGIGRSTAVLAALCRLSGDDNRSILKRGVHNRLLYQLIVQAGGMAVDREPLVSITATVYYPIDRLVAFLLSLERQRYKNWECILVTNGPRLDVKEMICRPESMIDFFDNSRIRLIENSENKGYWGHAYRQQGIDACEGEIIGLQNDDNYLTPGYIEQLVNEIQDGADMAMCDTVHSYGGYFHHQSSAKVHCCDLGCWLARADLVKSIPWPGAYHTADGDFIERLAGAAKKVAYVRNPLFVHN